MRSRENRKTEDRHAELGRDGGCAESKGKQAGPGIRAAVDGHHGLNFPSDNERFREYSVCVRELHCNQGAHSGFRYYGPKIVNR
jgi:hypothetical protein